MNRIKVNKGCRVAGLLTVILLVTSSFQTKSLLKGTWEYAGDVFHGKAEGPPTEYSLQRKYGSKSFESFLLEKGEKPQKYEGGDYTLSADTCNETQTYSSQNSQLIGITVHYLYSIRNDTLTLRGKLPNGNMVKEFWKKIK
jgi:hypothetical protein